MSSENVVAKQLEEHMDKLSKYRGRVVVTYVEDGKNFTENGELEEVNTKNTGGSLKIKLFNEIGDPKGGLNLPFLGVFSTAIQQVTDEKGNVLYENRLVDKSYNKSNSPKVREECGFKKLI